MAQTNKEKTAIRNRFVADGITHGSVVSLAKRYQIPYADALEKSKRYRQHKIERAKLLWDYAERKHLAYVSVLKKLHRAYGTTEYVTAERLEYL